MIPPSFATALRRAILAGLRSAFSAIVWFVVLALAGSAGVVAGVYVLGGLGWALLTAGGLALAVATLLLVGMNRAA